MWNYCLALVRGEFVCLLLGVSCVGREAVSKVLQTIPGCTVLVGCDVSVNG
ncbi:hypothetical protein GLYMA_01G122166v4 [Glycine max]|nr:hypothetical protein GLYMA_01G122166v4 [Glycine max]KAH1162774.1 hypothetical protein GYH30_001325 [Glycine max]